MAGIRFCFVGGGRDPEESSARLPRAATDLQEVSLVVGVGVELVGVADIVDGSIGSFDKLVRIVEEIGLDLGYCVGGGVGRGAADGDSCGAECWGPLALHFA